MEGMLREEERAAGRPHAWGRLAGRVAAAAMAAIVAACGGGGGGGGEGADSTTPPPAPVITTQPAAQTVDDGAAASFSVAASGSGLAYQWQRNGSAVAGATAATYTIATAALADDGARFSVVVSNAGGSVTSSEALLSVRAVAPTLTTAPLAVSTVAGRTATFSVVAAGSAPLAYQWLRDGVEIAGATAASYTTVALTLADDGRQFAVRVSNAAGSVTSAAVALGVSPAPVAPEIATQPAAATVAAGQTATFAVTATGTAPLAYQWRRNGAPIDGATGGSYTTGATTVADSGAAYSVVVSNAAGSVTSADAVLTVTPVAPTPGLARLATGGRLGITYSAARSAGGGVWLWGANTRGEIGDGTFVNRPLPFAWTLPVSGTALSLGNESTMVVLADGSARWAGTGANGQNGTAAPFSILTSPTPVTVLGNQASASVGNGFTVAARTDGTVWGWGALPTGARSEAAVQLAGFVDIAEICVADESIVARKRDGTVWFAGADRGGAMPGQGREITSVVATAVQVGGLSDVVQIACGTGTPTAFGLARRRDGSVFSWGSSGGLGYTISGFVQLAPQAIPGLVNVAWIAASNTGMAAAFAVGTDGQVRSWGFDRFGALALGDLSPSTAVVTPRLSTAIDGVVEVATSGEHTLFVKRDGTVWAVGSNASGQLGNTSTAALGSTLVPVPVTGLNLN